MRHPALLLTLVLVACGGDATETTDPTPGGSTVVANATVRGVVDGDTIDVRVQGRNERVRLIGIDTPESVAPDRPDECYGAEAARLTEELLPVGTPVRLERDVEARDPYERLLAYVVRASDGLFVNLELAERGAADVLVVPPNTAHADEIRAAVEAARRAGRGLWGVCGSADVPVG